MAYGTYTALTDVTRPMDLRNLNDMLNWLFRTLQGNVGDAEVNTLTFNKLIGGILALGGAANGNGEFSLKDEGGNVIITGTKDGFIIGDPAGEHAHIYVDADGKPRIDMYDQTNLKRSSWSYDGMRFFDADENTTTLVAATTAAMTITAGTGKDFATPQEAVDSLPKTIEHAVQITVDPGTYSPLSIKGFTGGGALMIVGVSTPTLERINITACSVALVMVQGFAVTGTGALPYAVAVYGSRGVQLNALAITESSANDGIWATNSIAEVSNSTISNRGIGIKASTESVVGVGAIAGTGNTIGISAEAAVITDIGSNTITGATPRVVSNGGIITSRLLTLDNTQVDTWTPTLTGFSANPTGIYRYRKIGTVCECWVRMTTNGTSNATTFTISLPFTAATESGMIWGSTDVDAVDNGSTLTTPGSIQITSGATAASLYTNAAGAGWTASGNKRVVWAHFTYETA